MGHGSRFPLPQEPTRNEVLQRLYTESGGGEWAISFTTLCTMARVSPDKCDALHAHLLEYQLIEDQSDGQVRITDKGKAQLGL